MIRRPTLRLAIVTLSFASIVLALSGVGGGKYGHWYLFFSPLVLAACFFGLRGALVTGTATLGSLVFLYRNSLHSLEDARAVLAASQQDFQAIMSDFSTLDTLTAEEPLRALVGTLLLVLGAMVIGQLHDRNRRQEERMAMLLRQDPLTGLLTRQQFLQTLRIYSQGQFSEGNPLALALFDVDNFGRLQGRYGHFSGDVVLERIGEILQAYSSKGYFVGRLGSDEFGVASRAVSPLQMRVTAEAIRATLAEYDWTGAPDEDLAERLTASFGVAFLPQDSSTPGELMRAAWQAVDEQKRSGGDGIRYASSMPEPEPEPTPVQAATIDEWRELVLRLSEVN